MCTGSCGVLCFVWVCRFWLICVSVSVSESESVSESMYVMYVVCVCVVCVYRHVLKKLCVLELDLL